MSEENKTKEGNVQLPIFKSWRKKAILGYGTDEKSLVALWCKLCIKLIDKKPITHFLKRKRRWMGHMNRRWVMCESR